jgi:hypothetical protein
VSRRRSNGAQTKLGWPCAQPRLTSRPGTGSAGVEAAHSLTFGQQNDVLPGRHGVAIDLRLDVDDLLGHLLQSSDVDLAGSAQTGARPTDFDVKVADVADNGV